MSKSLGNTTDPKDVLKDYGADILRLWVTTSDYTRDLRIGPKILKQTAESYRRLRYSLRYLLGGLAEFAEGERVERAEMPVLERWLLHKLWALSGELEEAFAEYDFHRAFLCLHHFANSDLSSFYFDIRKDSLYCDAPDNKTRRAVRSVFDLCFEFLAVWLSPILAFTTEAAWQCRGKDLDKVPSVHLALAKTQKELSNWQDESAHNTIEALRPLRRVITGALEQVRTQQKGQPKGKTKRATKGTTKRTRDRGRDGGRDGFGNWLVLRSQGIGMDRVERKRKRACFRSTSSRRSGTRQPSDCLVSHAHY